MEMESIASVASSARPCTQFPAGLRVLVVDDDATCLKILEHMLRHCRYDVTTCSRAVVALSMLRERKQRFDLVLSDVYMPDMDGFKLLEHIGLEMDLPVIMMSADDGKDVVMKGVTHGACDYLIKPVRMEALKTIWQHVVRKKKNELKELETSGSLEESDKQKRVLDDSDNASSVNEGNWKNVKRRKEGKEEEEDEADEREDSSTMKKPRVVWSIELHKQFVAAVNQLGVDKAVPKKILELMNVPGLTRENVASHLQKYRLYLRRVSVPQQGRFDAVFTGATQAAFGSSNSLDAFDLQALAVSGHFPSQSLVAMHAGTRRVANSSVDPISFFNSDAHIANSRLRSVSGQVLNNKQISLLSGPSTSTESTQTGHSQAIQPYGNTSIGLRVNDGNSGFLNLPSSVRACSSFPGGTINGHPNNSFVMQMSQRGHQFSLPQQHNHVHIDMQRQPQLRGELLNGLAGENNMLSSTLGQQILPNELSSHVTETGRATLNRNRPLGGTYVNSSSYTPVPQGQYAEFQNSYSLGSNMGSMFQEAVPATGSVHALNNSTSLKGVKDFIPSYDLVSELRQSKGQDWQLQNTDLSYDSAKPLRSQQNNINFGSSGSVHQDLNATLKGGSSSISRDTCTARKEIISVRAEIGPKVGSVAQCNNPFLIENSVKVRAGGMPNSSAQDMLFSDDVIQNELMNVISRQPQEMVGQGEAEYNFDGYPSDDIPV